MADQRFPAFRRFRYTVEYAGFPCIVSVSQNEVVVGDWSGNLFSVGLAPAGVKETAFVASQILGQVLVCHSLRSLTVPMSDPMSCAVATRGSYAVVWDRRTGKATRINAQVGPVNSVEWFAGGELLVIGSGYYPLGAGERRQASIEVWNLSNEEPTLLAATALPGVCVDAFAPCLEGDGQLVCFTGMESQDQGFLCLVDARSLRPEAFYELPFIGVRRIACIDEFIVLSHGTTVRAIRKDDGKDAWVQDIGEGTADFAYDPDHEQLFLTDGSLVSVWTGEVEERLRRLKDCSALATRPDGGFVGVSTTGVIGVWDRES